MALLTKVRTQLGIPVKNTATVDDTVASVRVEDAVTEAEETVEATDEETQGQGGWLYRRKTAKKLAGSFESYPHLLALKPKEKYVFRSDYFEVDNSVACILAFFHDDASQDGFAAFWGIDRIPDGLDDSVTAVVLEQIVRTDENWVDSYLRQSERIGQMDAGEQAEAGTTSTKRKAAKVAMDLDMIIAETQNGASYLGVHNRLFLKAPDLETLEDSIDRVTRLYIDRFGTVKIAPYAGEQRQELAELWAKNDKKRGRGFGFSSTELAGSYSLVTNGLNDRRGEYVGYMVGDVNNSAVLMDVNKYEHHVVVADGSMSRYLEGAHTADMWCSKISQAAMLDNGKVVHLVLNRAKLDDLGPRFDQLTSRVDLNHGDVNMFEMFGEEENELAIFASHLEKLKLMFGQFHPEGSATETIINSALADTATQFYVDNRMWRHNAKAQRHRLRLVNIPHEQVPRLQMFKAYLDTAHKALLNSNKTDPDQLRAYNVLRGIANEMLHTNDDLFNNHTATSVDGVRDARRVVYDFSRLMVRGKAVAMAQLVNIIGFAIGKLGTGDTVIIHGAEEIDPRVRDYITQQFERLHEKNGRVVYSYNDVDKMLADSTFNKFDAADYTILGPMREPAVNEYQRQLAQQIPPDLTQLITTRGENLSYLRREFTNVVFHLDLALGINPEREAERRRLWEAAQQAEKQALVDSLMSKDMVAGAGNTSIRKTEESLVVDDDTSGRAAAKKAQEKKKELAAAAQAASVDLTPSDDATRPRKLVRR